MDRERANIVVGNCVRATKYLGEVAYLIGDDDRALKLALGAAIHDILTNIVVPIQEAHPDLKADMESKMEKYGRSI